MSSKIPKTGLAKRIREAMSAQVMFTSQQLCDALGTPPGTERDRVYRAINDFIRRGEVTKVTDRRRKKQIVVYRYRKVELFDRSDEYKQKIYKAMRLMSFHGPFALSDIQKMTGLDRSYIDKLAKKLRKSGRLAFYGYRKRSSSYGREAAYQVIDTDRFRVEVMK
jgi:predicted transcriptional regulator